MWKHSYFQVDKSFEQMDKMRSYSKYSKPCLDLTDGWCNVPDKQPPGYTEQMVAAYHNGTLVYAYRAPLNSQLGKTNYGAYLSTTNKVVDRCTRSNGDRPSIMAISSGERPVLGISFDKHSPTDFNHHCDTDRLIYSGDCRWESCQLPFSISSRTHHVQMTGHLHSLSGHLLCTERQ